MKVKMYELNKKTISTLIMTILMLSMALALPAAVATDGIKITSPTETLDHGPTGTATWTTDQAKSGGYSVKLYTAGGVDSYGVVKIPIGLPLQSFTTEPSYWVYETTVVSDRHPYVNIVLDLDGDGVFDSCLAGTVSRPTTNTGPGDLTQPLAATWTEMKEAVGYVGSLLGGGFIDGIAEPKTFAYWLSYMATHYLNAKVILVQLRFGNWGAEAATFTGSAYVDNMKIGGVTYPLEPKEGPVGAKTAVAGYSATPGGLIKVYWDAVPAGYLAEGSASAIFPYAYSIGITIPEAVVGAHGIVVKDMESSTVATTTFTVTSKIVLSPTSGIVGDTITITGTGFKATSPITISGTPVTILSTPTTSALGSFTGTFSIKDVPDAIYTITATDGVNPATATLKVGTVITLTPKTGLTGTTVTILGRGFTPDETVDVKWPIGTGYLTIINDYPISSTGTFTTTFTVPLVDTGDYLVKAVDSEEESAEAKFTVTGVTKITLTPKSGLPGIPVTVDGEWFTAGKTVTVYFDATSVGTVTASSTGTFSDKTITIPVAATFGAHTIKAIDSEGVYATKTFTVVERVIVIETRSTSYMPGDTISFNIYSTVEFKKTDAVYDNIVIEIEDPDGYLFWSVGWKPVMDAEIAKWTVPYSAQNVTTSGLHLTLPSDAKAGLWKWNATYYLADVVAKIVKSGSFTVKAVTAGVIDEKITALEQSINLLGVQILAAQTAATAAQTAATTAGTKATAAETAAKAAQTTAQAATTAAQAATTAAQASTTAANAAKASADAAKAATDSLTTLVYVAIGASAIAALAAVFAVMQISKKIA